MERETVKEEALPRPRVLMHSAGADRPVVATKEL
jgi:hypothetical protein